MMKPFAIMKQIVFAEESTLAVGGSDNGLLHMYHITNGEEIQTLKHGAGMIFNEQSIGVTPLLMNQSFHCSASC